jgi:S-adenosylmethionine synthetase
MWDVYGQLFFGFLIWAFSQLALYHIAQCFALTRSIFRPTAAYGHFGVAGRPWEEVIKI